MTDARVQNSGLDTGRHESIIARCDSYLNRTTQVLFLGRNGQQATKKNFIQHPAFDRTIQHPWRKPTSKQEEYATTSGPVYDMSSASWWWVCSLSDA